MLLIRAHLHRAAPHRALPHRAAPRCAALRRPALCRVRVGLGLCPPHNTADFFNF